MLELRRGLLDPKRLPGVSNGTWLVRVRISDPDRPIPPYIIRREEGELWSLSFEGRRFVCWKCGSPDHLGDKCRGPEKTFEEVFGGPQNANSRPSWAAVVRGDSDLDDGFRLKRDALEKQIQMNNVRKAIERQEVEDTVNTNIGDVLKAVEMAAKESVNSISDASYP